MVVEFEPGEAADRLSYRSAHCEVRDEMPVHDVDVKHFDTSFFNAPNIFAQPNEICRENGRNDLSHTTTLLSVTRETSTKLLRRSHLLRRGQVAATLRVRTAGQVGRAAHGERPPRFPQARANK